jgi:glycerophosphoryl diester phosphodiesterase
MARAVLVLLVLASAAWARRPRVFAHRGARVEAPENSRRAFRLARKLGADAIELDVHRARSGEIVVHHDPVVRLPSGAEARIRDLDLAELRRIDLGGGERIPTLEEALGELGPRMAMNIELKGLGLRSRGLEREVARIVDEAGVGKRILVSSFNPLALLKMRYHAPALARAWLFSDLTPRFLRGPFTARLLGATSMHPADALVDAASVARWQAAGLRVRPYTVNDPERMRALARLGVDGLFTDDPRLALRVLREGRKD